LRLNKSIRKQVLATQADAEKDGVVVPITLEEYCIKQSSSKDSNEQNEDCILDDLDDLDPYDNNDDNNSQYESNDDSGNEES
jgi:ubiquitin-conjugating enzyme E2 R